MQAVSKPNAFRTHLVSRQMCREKPLWASGLGYRHRDSWTRVSRERILLTPSLCLKILGCSLRGRSAVFRKILDYQFQCYFWGTFANQIPHCVSNPVAFQKSSRRT